MTESLFKIFAAALSIWEHKEKTRYLDRHEKLQKEYYIEINKPLEQRDNSILDNIEFELRVLSSAFVASIGKPNA